LSQDQLLALFKGQEAAGAALQPASLEDMMGRPMLARKSLEVVYDKA
jgi:chlorophyllide a reductase subunit X